MLGRPFALRTWQENRTRRRVVRSGAQYALYFALGLALVSLLVGLNVFLAAETTALTIRIRELEKQRLAVQWRIAEISGEIAITTNVRQIDDFAEQRGFVDDSPIIYVDPQPTALQPPANPTLPESEASPRERLSTSDLTWQELLGRIRSALVTRWGRGEVATTR